MRQNYLTVLCFMASLSVVGCAKTWVKPGSTEAEFNKDKYECLQQSQQQVSGFAFNTYGGAGGSQQKTNDGLFTSCMNARGYSIKNQSEVKESAANNSSMFQAISEKIKQDSAFRCTNSDYAAIYAKTACKAEDITIEQMSDKSKITPAQKTNFSALRSSIDESLREGVDKDRKYGGPKGVKVGNYVESVYMPKLERLNLDLYNGKITWGDYNKSRKELYSELRKFISTAN